MSMYSRIKPGQILGEQWFSKAALAAHADAYVDYLTERGYDRGDRRALLQVRRPLRSLALRTGRRPFRYQ